MSTQLQTVQDHARRLGWPPHAAAAGLPADPLDLLEGKGSRRTVQRGQEICAAGSPADAVYRVLSGSVRSFWLIEDGRRQIAAFLLPGDLLGFESLGAYHLSAEAVTDAVLARIPRQTFDSLMHDHPELCRRLHGLALANLRAAHEKMVLLGRRTAGERVAAFLLDMAERNRAGPGLIELPMTRGDIADHLGITLETVSRTLSQLKRERIISVVKAGIRIQNHATLAQFGTEVCN